MTDAARSAGVDDPQHAPLLPVRPDDAAGVSGVVDCSVYEHGRRRAGTVALSQLGSAVSADEGFVWVSLHEPGAGQMAAVGGQLRLPELAVEDAVQAHQRPKLETYDEQVFAVIKPVRYLGDGKDLESSEISVFVGAGYVVTVQHGDSGAVELVRRELDQNGAALADFGPAGVLHRLVDLVVDEYQTVLQALGMEIDEVEQRVFGRDDGDHAECVYQLKQYMAELRRAVAPLISPLQRLAAGAVPQVPRQLTPYFRDVHDHVQRAADAVEAADRLLSDVLQADLSRISVRQNEIALRQNEVAARQNEDMRKISAWAAIGLVPTAVAGIYGMNFENMPELRTQYGYYVVLAVIVSSCLLLYRLFRRNGWL
ncbi:Mg2 transporter protein CorA family protein [Micromonospora aurantiaca ATCC 27029]|nr:Mg2 transporter protein CorA family protein [Micromonospora aurantiaca ATCC 27029]